MVLKTGNLELASYCVRHAADLNAALGGSPTQQAIVQTFLKNYSKVCLWLYQFLQFYDCLCCKVVCGSVSFLVSP